MLSSGRPIAVILRRSDEPTDLGGRTAAIPSFHLRYNTRPFTKTRISQMRPDYIKSKSAQRTMPRPRCPIAIPYFLSSLGGPSCSSRGNRFLFGLGSDPSRLPNPGWAMEQARENASRCLGACSLDDRDSRSASAARVIKKRRRPLRSRPRFPEREIGRDCLRLFQLSTRSREHLLIS